MSYSRPFDLYHTPWFLKYVLLKTVRSVSHPLASQTCLTQDRSIYTTPLGFLNMSYSRPFDLYQTPSISIRRKGRNQRFMHLFEKCWVWPLDRPRTCQIPPLYPGRKVFGSPPSLVSIHARRRINWWSSGNIRDRSSRLTAACIVKLPTALGIMSDWLPASPAAHSSRPQYFITKQTNCFIFFKDKTGQLCQLCRCRWSRQNSTDQIQIPAWWRWRLRTLNDFITSVRPKSSKFSIPPSVSHFDYHLESKITIKCASFVSCSWRGGGAFLAFMLCLYFLHMASFFTTGNVLSDASLNTLPLVLNKHASGAESLLLCPPPPKVGLGALSVDESEEHVNKRTVCFEQGRLKCVECYLWLELLEKKAFQWTLCKTHERCKDWGRSLSRSYEFEPLECRRLERPPHAFPNCVEPRCRSWRDWALHTVRCTTLKRRERSPVQFPSWFFFDFFSFFAMANR